MIFFASSKLVCSAHYHTTLSIMQDQDVNTMPLVYEDDDMGVWQSVMHTVERDSHQSKVIELHSRLPIVLTMIDCIVALPPCNQLKMCIEEMTQRANWVLECNNVTEMQQHHTIQIWEVWILEIMLIQGLTVALNSLTHSDSEYSSVSRQQEECRKRIVALSETVIHTDSRDLGMCSDFAIHKHKLNHLLIRMNRL
jgi:hypothetical protein